MKVSIRKLAENRARKWFKIWWSGGSNRTFSRAMFWDRVARKFGGTGKYYTY